MPARYIHTKRGKTMKYGQADLERAVRAVNLGASVREAAATYKVPRSTIGDRISGKHDVLVRHGRPPAVPREVEDVIVATVKKAAQCGVGLSRKQILLRANRLCQRSNIGGSYKGFKAGKDWWEGVKRRHPELTIRKPEKLSSVRARALNPEVVRKYFDDLASIFEELGLANKPEQVWNCDESGFNFEHQPVKVVAEKGSKTVVSRTSSKLSNLTVMACVNAAGTAMPPLLITKGKTSKSIHGFNTDMAPEGTVWAYQENGWINDDIGELWFQEVFLKHGGEQRPQLLVLDGHSSHENMAILELAIQNKIVIIALPPHSTHMLQPLDRSIFGPMKAAYNHACSAFMQGHPLHLVNKWTFPSLFNEAWALSMTNDNIKKGFSACGIFPLNPQAIKGDAFRPSEITDVEEAPTTAEIHSEVTTDTQASVKQSTNDSMDIYPVLDISDPSQLMELITSGQFLLDDLSDTHGNNAPLTPPTLMLSPEIPTLSPELPTMSPSTMSPELPTLSPPTTFPEVPTLSPEVVVKQQVESVFMPVKLEERPRTQPARRKITGHRLLTSPELLAEKRALVDKKLNKAKKSKKSI